MSLEVQEDEDRLKRYVGILVLAIFAMFCAVQLWFALVDGVVWSGPRHDTGWHSYQTSPGWFIFGIVLHGGSLAIVLGFFTFISYVSPGSDARWRRWSQRPPLLEESHRRVVTAPPKPPHLPKPE